jgi:hypothetical protein
MSRPTTSVLTVSVGQYLTGEPVDELVERNWQQKASPEQRQRFKNFGFNVDPTDFAKNLSDLRSTLRENDYDGVLLAWCMRGYPERTELFEDVTNVVVDELRAKPKTKLIFNTGPTDIVEPTLRNFP